MTILKNMVRKITRVDYSNKFIKLFRKSPSYIQKAIHERIDLFLKDSYSSQLRNHELTGNYKGHRSINITGDWRVIFSEQIDNNGNIILIFELLGTHSQLYK
jgi:addiction module RelE/StbE family toxin